MNITNGILFPEKKIPIKNVIIRMIMIKDLLLLLLVKINGKSKIVKRLNF